MTEIWVVYITFYGDLVPQAYYTSKEEAEKHKKHINTSVLEDVIVEQVFPKEKFEPRSTVRQ